MLAQKLKIFQKLCCTRAPNSTCTLFLLKDMLKLLFHLKFPVNTILALTVNSKPVFKT